MDDEAGAARGDEAFQGNPPASWVVQPSMPAVGLDAKGSEMSTLFGAFLGVVTVLAGLLVILSGAAFCLTKLCDMYEFVERRQDEARLHNRIAELEAALAVATAGGVYRSTAVPSSDQNPGSG